MSRQNKQARNLAMAKEFSKIRKSGGRSPSKTAVKHGKKKERRRDANPEVLKAKLAVLQRQRDAVADFKKQNEKARNLLAV